MHKLRTFLVALSLSLIFAPCLALATSVDPESASLVVNPGQSASVEITFSNNDQQVHDYALELSGINFGTTADDLQFVSLSSEERGDITFTPATFKLEPGAKQVVSVTVSAPASALSQELAFAVIATTPGGTSSGVNVQSGLAAVIFARIGAPLPSQLSLQDFQILPSGTHHLPLQLAALIHNTGGGLVVPQAVVEVKNIWGHKVTQLDLNPAGRRLPGNTSRIFTAEWAGGFGHFGPFKLDLQGMGANGEILSASQRVVLFPWQMLVLVGSIGLVGALTIYVAARVRRP